MATQPPGAGAPSDAGPARLGQGKLEHELPSDLDPGKVKQIEQELQTKKRDKDQKSEKTEKGAEDTDTTDVDKNPSRTAGKSRPNPYDDVPSLHDLYKQLSSSSAITRFGAAIFQNKIGNTDDLPMDLPVGPDYVLGPGDGVNIDVWGSVSDRLQRVIDRQGLVTLPEVGSIQAAGLSLGAMQRGVETLLNTRYRNIRATVSLARLRSVRVYVVGDVERPGAYDISSLSTVLNALFAAGGPTEHGSMRIARHYRGQQLIEEVDLYELILRGVRADMQRLQPGDTVLVPPAGAQVSIEGMVHRPAIYELHGERSLAEVLAMAGGVLPTGTLRHLEVERVQAHEKRSMLSLDLPETADSSAADRMVQEFQVQDQDQVRVWPILPYSEKTVFLTGHVRRPGKYSYREGLTVADLIKSSYDLLPEPSQHAELIRLMPPEFRPVLLSFNVSPTEGKVEPIPLTPFDTVRIFSRFDFEDAPKITINGEVRNPGLHKLDGETHLRDAIYLAGGLTTDALINQAQVYRRLPDSTTTVLTINLAKAMSGDPASNILLKGGEILMIHSNLAKVDPPKVYIHGEVASPGSYPLSPGMTASELVKMAGGFTRGAYKDKADLARYTLVNGEKVVGDHRTVEIAKALQGDNSVDVQLQDADVLSIRKVVGWDEVGASVTITGEVAHSGTYGIRQGERLSSLIKRAGGFRTLAYPQAAVLERVQVRELANKSRQDLIDRLQAEQISTPQYSSKSSAEEQMALSQTLAQQRQQALQRLRNTPASGRLVIHISQDVARWENTAADIELRPGDTIHVPNKPQFVVIGGEVFNPTSINYSPGKTAAWYLTKAGGPTEFAARKSIFVVAADGSVVGGGNSSGFWEHGVLGRKMQPGDSIVVPEKIQGGSQAWKHLLDSAQFFSAVAIAAKVASGL